MVCERHAARFIVEPVAASTTKRGTLLGAALAWAGSLVVTLGVLVASGCTTIDPGDNFVVSNTTFDQNYFYCHVEPQYIFANSCGSGDPSKGDHPNGCHFNPSAVSGMALIDHPAVDCAGGDVPVDMTQIGTGSPAESNLESVSIEMSADWVNAPLFVRPSSGSNHPRQIFSASDATVTTILSTWASK